MKIISNLIIGLFLCLFSLASNAASFVSVTPNTINNHPVATNPAIILTWTVTAGGNDGTGQISTAGTFYTPAGSPMSPVTGSVSDPACLSGATCPISELLQIPASIITQARNSGFAFVSYQRTFVGVGSITSGAFTETASTTVMINLLIPAANPDAVLAVNRLALRFSDNTSVKVIQPDTHIMAVADISYTGSGLFDAMWEIAEPVSTMGQPMFVPMQPVRQFLVAGGRVYLQTPPLPTQKQGLHILRLRVAQPALSFTAPILQYSVSSQGNTSALPTLPAVRINAPVENALLAADTRFEWQAVKSAHAYQLELFLPEQAGLKPDDAAIAKRAPASGMMVPAKRNSLTLGELSRNKLRPNTTYYWRVIAIGNKGQILSTSALREIRIP